VQLLVEVLQRVQRMLNKSDQERYTAGFAPYVQGHAGQYVYHMRPKKRMRTCSGSASSCISCWSS